ncbi:MAG: hypothetical protein KIS92_18270 [Planctomycetota bacterium]|nr:hypothetical protein [Planctomycetota bacterium]
MKTWRVLGGLVAAGGVAACVWAANFWLGRPDRIAAERRRVALFEVRDQIMRYESEKGALPKSLDDLKGPYLRPDQLDGAPYVYDPVQRLLKEARGCQVAGLWSYTMPERTAELPVPDGSQVAHTNVAQPPDEAKSAAPESPAKTEPEPPSAPEPKGPLDLLTSSACVVPVGPDLPAPPEGALVFEAEHFSETNYGWEVRADAQAGGGAYLHCKEGIANGPGQTRYDMGDFYNERATKDVTYLRYHVRVPRAGAYYVYGRMWTTDTKCSNAICVGIDEGGPNVGAMENRTPYRWVWSPLKDHPRQLAAGDHFIHLFIHEDGVRFDQFILSPTPIDGGAAYASNFATGRGTAWQEKTAAPAHLSFDYETMVMTPGLPPQARVAVRRLKAGRGQATLRAVLRGAGKDGADYVALEGVAELEKLPEVALLALDFKGLDLAALPRREYLLHAELSQDGKTLAECRTPLIRPWDWEVFGPGRFYNVEETARLDGDGEARELDKRAWLRFADKSYDHFGVLDFGVQYSQNSQHPVQHVTAYARTRIRVPAAGTYLFKIQADDQMILWIDGKEVFRHRESMPVTRGGDRVKIPLEAGEHRMRFRLNQMEGRWQGAVRIRAEDDGLSDIVGLPSGLPDVLEAPARKDEAPQE